MVSDAAVVLKKYIYIIQVIFCGMTVHLFRAVKRVLVYWCCETAGEWSGLMTHAFDNEMVIAVLFSDYKGGLLKWFMHSSSRSALHRGLTESESWWVLRSGENDRALSVCCTFLSLSVSRRTHCSAVSSAFSHLSPILLHSVPLVLLRLTTLLCGLKKLVSFLWWKDQQKSTPSGFLKSPWVRNWKFCGFHCEC